MQAILMMVLATGLFAGMGVTVKLSAGLYGTFEIVFYRGVVGMLLTWAWSRWLGVGLRTRRPAMHAWRSVVGVSSLVLWFYAISQLPLATAVTLNYMSSVWIAVLLLGAAIWHRHGSPEPALLLAVLVGFAGVVLMLQPTMAQQAWLGALAGLVSGLLSALAYLQVGALGKAGEPEPRVVFWFSAGSVLAGALGMWATLGGAGWQPWQGHTPRGLALLLATGVLATAAQLLLTRAYTLGRPMVNASLQYLGIVYSFAFGVWLFADAVSWPSLLGMVLIVGAGLTATMLRHPAPPKR